MGKKIECLDLSKRTKKMLKEKFQEVENKSLGIIRIGEDGPSKVYVKKKDEACKEVGVDSEIIILKEEATLKEVVNTIDEACEKHTAVMVQLPLPKHLQRFEQFILDRIPTLKDVDALRSNSFDYSDNIVATGAGIMMILNSEDIETEGKDILIIGRGKTVALSMAKYLSTRGNATVTVCHSKAKVESIARHLKHSDIIISAVGKSEFITEDMLGDQQVLIDVGMSRNAEGKLTGDFHSNCYEKSSFYTTTPGGTGVMTITGLLMNLLVLAKRQEQHGK